MNWDDAVAAAASYKLAGEYEWHLAYESELKKLYSYRKETQAGHIKVNKQDARVQKYWMFDCCFLPFMGGGINFKNGNGDSYLKSISSGVRPVRSY